MMPNDVRQIIICQEKERCLEEEDSGRRQRDEQQDVERSHPSAFVPGKTPLWA